eukprot:5891787-Pyramimonas_sp.AAC.1
MPMSPTTQFAAEILCGLSPLPSMAPDLKGCSSRYNCSLLGGAPRPTPDAKASRVSTRSAVGTIQRSKRWRPFSEDEENDEVIKLAD